MNENQYIITIEFCSNCKEHEKITSHHADLYKNYALSLQKCILLRFPFISVLLKPIETDIKKGEGYKLPKVSTKGVYEKKFINDLFKEVRIGAFEIELSYKFNGEVKTIPLHSKLETKLWPKIENILNKIVNYMPKFIRRIIVYQKETEDEEEDQTQLEETKNQNGEIFEEQNQNNRNNGNNGNSGSSGNNGNNGNNGNSGSSGNNGNNEKNEIFQNGLIEGLKINVYLQKNSQIAQISNISWETIQNEKDPHKRRIMNKEKEIIEKQEMIKSGTNYNAVIENKKFNRSRPSIAYSNRKNYSIFKNSRPSSSKNRVSLYTDIDYINSGVNPMEENLILDKKVSQNLKEKLIISKYTNIKGFIDIGPLPYDSYYVEVSESKTISKHRNVLSI